ncbi:MAG: SGNH/GDSL hydrolase family protein [Acidimicrobiales bacterium]
MVRPTLRATRAAALLAALALTAASCTPVKGKALGTAPPANLSAPKLYAAIGSSDARGTGTDVPLRQAWPQVLFATLPANFRFVNLALPDATVADVLAQSLPIAEDLRPALVTISLSVEDMLRQVPVATYEAELRTLLHALRATGATVLLANAPPVQDLPGYLACLDGGTLACSPRIPHPVAPAATVAAEVTSYNRAITDVAQSEGAAVVDLYGAALAAAAQGIGPSLLAADGLDPNAAGAQRIAAGFAAALHRP